MADVLRSRINKGEYEPGDLLPSQRELREEFDISTTTAKAAIAQLEKEGLIYSQQGKGVFVQTTRELLRYTAGRYGQGRPPNLTEEEQGNYAYDVEAERRQVEVAAGIAERLGIEEGERVSEAVYTWTHEGETVMISSQWEPLSITGGTPIETPASGDRGQPDVITRFASIGIHVTDVREDIRTRMPTPDEAHRLKINAGVPVFHIQRTHFAGQTAVETAEIVMRGDRFVLRNEQVIPIAQ
ncbi:GntR family transcriptional regulator [Spirillospora albida]|uniref:GntR family transcriptional regulator n=1 Tax=Spirillospora albida TaxID=58123 RepID=UPI0014703E11|nr:GntR family transcriptional regulator [Spirillospora albida]